jgi:hypothetical protein
MTQGLQSINGQHCTRLLAREAWLMGVRLSEVAALYCELGDGRWFAFHFSETAQDWVGRWLARSPLAGNVDDDADDRHPLVDLAVHYGIRPARIADIHSRLLGALAELVIGFEDGSALVAHHRPAPGANSLTYVRP